MLKQIRENARIPLYILIIAFVALYAVSSHEGNPVAGKLFGKKVLLSDYQKAYVGARTQLILRYGELPRDPQIEKILEEETWDRLILLSETKKQRVKATDKEVVDFVKNFKFFNNSDGKFDKRLYEDILKYNFGITPPEFENIIRENIGIQKFVDKQSQKVLLSDEDVLKEYKFLNEKASAEYILFKATDYLPQVNVTEDEVKTYFEKHKDLFKIAEQVNVEYVLKAFPNDKEESKQKIRTEMRDIFYEFDATKDFTAAAKKLSLPVKDTGFFDRNSKIPEIGYDLKFADAALSLNVGQISNPVETKSGIYILKVKDKKPARDAEFAEVKDGVEKALKTEKADTLAKTKAEELLAEVKKGTEKLEDVAKRFSLATKKTDIFVRNQYIEGLGVVPEFANAAFSAKQGEVFGEIAKVHDGYAIVKQDSIIPIDEKKFQEEKDKFKESMLAQKKYLSSITWFYELKKKANLQSNLDKMRARN